MKKTTKIISLCITVVFLVMILTACGSSSDPILGTYKGSYTHEDSKYEVTINLHDDGTYYFSMMKNNIPHSVNSGEYKVHEGVLGLHSGDGSWSDIEDLGLYSSDNYWLKYNFTKNVLENNNHKFKKTQ